LTALAASGVSPLRVGQAVLVQAMVDTRAAGVLFSRDPGGRAETVLVNAARGLGEIISQGETSGDLYWVRRESGEVVASELGATTVRVAAHPDGGTRDVPLAPDERDRPCLSPADLRRLAELARALEAGTGRAQDVEFGFDEIDRLVVFQTRRVVPSRSV